MELCEGGELADVLKEQQTFSEEDTKKIMCRLTSAVAYLHKKGEDVGRLGLTCLGSTLNEAA